MSILHPEISKRLLSPQMREVEFSRASEMLKRPEQLNQQQLIEAWAIMTEYYKYNNQKEACVKANLKLIEIINSEPNKDLLRDCYSDFGDALYYFKDYDEARNYYQKTLNIIPPPTKIDSQLYLLSQLAYCCGDTGLFEEERMYLEKAIALSNTSLIKATLLERMAQSYKNSDQFDQAIEIYEQALSIFETEGFKRGWEQRIESLAGIYDFLGNHEAANKTRNRI
jgi:tetratricopeptide (TPR) repeat protein